MLLGCIADDFTGASDLANTLAKNGMLTVQFVGVPRGSCVACEAGVVALKTRSAAPADAVPVLPYTPPGSADVTPLVRARAANNAAMLLANHGPVVAGLSLDSAIFTMEELEETAKLVILTQGLKVRHLDHPQIAVLGQIFGAR